jgi:hypothetical protein
MPKIKNMGTATMRFKEGVIVSGSAGSDVHALSITGSIRTSDNIIVDGRIGIGTDNPGYKLEVGGNMAVGEYIYHRNDTNTFIQLQDDKISIETGGTERIRMDDDGVYIPDSPTNASLFVSGGIEVTPGNQEGLRFMKSSNELNFISFQDGDDGGSYNARLSYNSTEYLFIAPGRGGDFFINSGKTSGNFTYPFSIMDDGTAKFTKGLESSSDRATDLDSSIAFYVSGTVDGNNNAVFDGKVIMNASLTVETGISFEDVIMAELTIPGVQAQTDTNAFSFDLPYSVTFHKLVTRATRNVGNSGDTTVTVSNGAGTTLATTTITSAQAVGRTTTTSISSGDQSGNTIIKFAISAVGSNVQDLRANLFFKRNL